MSDDSTLESPRSLRIRESNRHEPVVTAALDAFWEATIQDQQNAGVAFTSPRLSKNAYLESAIAQAERIRTFDGVMTR
jgi:hypothetical protein